MHRTPDGRSVWMADPIKGSKFEAWIEPVTTEADAMAFLEEVRTEYPGATHHCWAFLLADGRSRSSDDGEPGGSAGRPILAQIQGHGVANAAVVVVRWYGGTKLGVGGLIRAYGGTAGKALDRCALTEVHAMAELSIRYAYSDTTAVEAVLARPGVEVLEIAYADDVSARLQTREPQLDELKRALVDATRGRIGLE